MDQLRPGGPDQTDGAVTGPVLTPDPPMWPAPTAGFPPAAPAPVVGRWSSLRGLEVALSVLFSLTALAAVVLAFTAHAMGSALDEDVSGDFPSFVRAVDSVTRYSNGLVLYRLLCVATGVVFIVWMYRVARNHELLGRPGSRFSPGWAIGGWFIPFANLVIPGRQMSQLWQGAVASTPRGDPAWRSVPRGRLVMAWWALYVAGLTLFAVSEIVTGVTVSIGSSEPDRNATDTVLRLVEEGHDVGTGVTLTIIAVLLSVAGALTAIGLVRGLSRRQLVTGVVTGSVAPTPAPTSSTGRPDSRRRLVWWVAVPTGLVITAGVVLVATSGGGGGGGERTAPAQGDGERFVDPEGFYEIELDPDWSPLSGARTAEELFAAGRPVGGLQPNLDIATARDADGLDESGYLETVLDALAGDDQLQVVDSGVITAPSGNRLAYVDLTFHDGVAVIHQHVVIDTSHGTSAVAVLTTPLRDFEEERAEAEPYLHTLHLTA